MPENFYMYFVTALIPMVVGAIYYNPKVFGNAWMKSNGFTEESLKGGNMLMIFGVSYLFSVLLSFAFGGIVIHQSGAFAMLMPGIAEAGSVEQIDFTALMEKYGNNFRTFGHGALHGVVFSLFFVLPLLGINALFERRGWKYIFIHLGYWMICLVLIGGVLCQTLQYAPLM